MELILVDLLIKDLVNQDQLIQTKPEQEELTIEELKLA